MDSTNKIIVIGAGGHGQVVADTIIEMNLSGRGIKLLGFVDDNDALEKSMINNLPVFGNIIIWLSTKPK